MFPVNSADTMWEIPKIFKFFGYGFPICYLLRRLQINSFKVSHSALDVSLIILEIVALPIRCAQPSDVVDHLTPDNEV